MAMMQLTVVKEFKEEGCRGMSCVGALDTVVVMRC